MARQQTSFQRLKSIVRAAVVGLVLVLLFEKLDGPAAPATNLLCNAAGETLALLTTFVPVPGKLGRPLPSITIGFLRVPFIC